MTKPSIQHILWGSTCHVIEETPQSKSCNWGQQHFEPSSFPRTEEEEFSHWLHITQRIPLRCFQSRHLELCLAAPELPALHSHLLYGCWQHKITFFLTTSPEPLCEAGPMSRNQAALSHSFFSPNLSRVLEAPSLTACVLGMIWGVFSNIKYSMILNWGMWLCSSFRLSQLITFPGLLCTEVRETFPK